MRVNFVYENRPGTWEPQFLRAVTQGLSKRGVDVIGVDLSDVSSRKEAIQRVAACLAPDCWYFMRHTDWGVDGAHHAPVVAHAHGGRETGAYCEFVDAERVSNKLVAVTTNTAAHAELFRSAHRWLHVRHTGFPVDFTAQVAQKVPGSIIVPGRLSPEKMPLWVADALAGYEDVTTFVCPEPRDRFGLVCQKVLIHRGFGVTHPAPAWYPQMLADAEAAVSAGASDTFNLAMVEAVLSGCGVLMPKLPPYTELYRGPLYEPFSFSSFRNLLTVVLDGKGPKLVDSVTDVEAVVDKILETLQWAIAK